MKFKNFVPLIIFATILIYFVGNLDKDPQIIPSNLIEKPLPKLELIDVQDFGTAFNVDDLKGKVTLLNFFGSWCFACIQEHSTLNYIRDKEYVEIYGIAWDEKESINTTRWLKKHGSPYTKVGEDKNSNTIVEYGITGAPETFIIGQKGLVRYKYIGIITKQVWYEELYPIVKQLQTEGI